VRQLSTSVDSFMLRDIFSSCGRVADVRVLPAHRSGNTLSAFVSFCRSADASRSIRVLHGLPLFGQPINVQMSRHAMQAAQTARAVRRDLLRGSQAGHAQQPCSESSDSESSIGSAADEESTPQPQRADGGFEELASQEAPPTRVEASAKPHTPPHTADSMQRHSTAQHAATLCLACCMRDRLRLQMAWDVACEHTQRCQGSMPALPPCDLRIVIAPHGPTQADKPYSFTHGNPAAHFVALGVCSAGRATDALLLAARQSSQYSQPSQTPSVGRRSPPPFPPQQQSRWRPPQLPPFSPLPSRAAGAEQGRGSRWGSQDAGAPHGDRHPPARDPRWGAVATSQPHAAARDPRWGAAAPSQQLGDHAAQGRSSRWQGQDSNQRPQWPGSARDPRWNSHQQGMR